MSATAERLKTELASLALEERAELAHFLIESLDEEADDDSEAAFNAELARRGAEIRSGQAIGEPADKVIAELREKYS